MMTAAEVIDLLSLAAGFDQRTVGEDDVRAWGLIANEEDWTLPLACRALVEHAKHNAMPARPAHLKAIIDGVGKRVRAQFTEDVCPPKELRDDPRAEIEWRRERIADYTRRALEAWAQGGEIPALEQRQELGERERPQLAAAVRDMSARWSVPTQPRKAPGASRRTALDRARLARAREEVANRPPVDVEGEAS